ncbi:MAG: response regulator [Lachnospiraceae bacterium]|nr:response regulator [Lachnospiraceae bacterium]
MKTILLVDDENINHILAKRIMRDVFRLESVYSGAEALKKLREQTVDLILMDIIMPEQDGFETFRNIREEGICPDVPVIFLTAKEDDALKEKCLQEGAKAYVTKPFSPTGLLKTLQEVLHD